jgi:hypothetical protein
MSEIAGAPLSEIAGAPMSEIAGAQPDVGPPFRGAGGPAQGNVREAAAACF